jgi:hypothetical protein
VTEWDEFVAFSIRRRRRQRCDCAVYVVYDGRNALDASRWTEAGLRVMQVGPTLSPAGDIWLNPAAEMRLRRLALDLHGRSTLRLTAGRVEGRIEELQSE